MGGGDAKLGRDENGDAGVGKGNDQHHKWASAYKDQERYKELKRGRVGVQEGSMCTGKLKEVRERMFGSVNKS